MLELLTSLAAPATFSVLFIGLVLLLVAFVSKLLGEVVKVIINEKAWDKEIINSNFISDKLYNLLLGSKAVKGVPHYSNFYTLSEYQGFFIFSDGTYGLELEPSPSSWHLEGSGVMYISKFKTKEEAYKRAEELGILVEKEETDFTKPTVAVVLAIAADILLHLFSAFPVATLSLVGVSCLVFSVRWLSGKLAENVHRTDNHEERIVKLEKEEGKDD